MDLGESLAKLLGGLRTVGDAFTELVLYLFQLLGIQVPAMAVRLATIIFIILVVWKYSDAMSRIALYILLFILLSTGTGLLGELTGLFSTIKV
jgi:hypothetical protein